MLAAIGSDLYTHEYSRIFDGDEHWQQLPSPTGALFDWDPDSTYVREPPYFVGMSPEPTPPVDIVDARVLALLGDSITTDHISPAGSIAGTSPAALLSPRARRRAARLQHVRRAARQPRRHGARHLRQHPPPQPACRRQGGRLDGASSRRRGDEHLRRLGAVPGRGHPADHHRRARVRLRLVTRLGGERPAAARRSRGDRRVLRADPPQQPRRHGHPAAAVPRRSERRDARASTAPRSTRFETSRRRRRARRFVSSRVVRIRPTSSSTRSHGSTARPTWSTSAMAAFCRSCSVN